VLRLRQDDLRPRSRYGATTAYRSAINEREPFAIGLPFPEISGSAGRLPGRSNDNPTSRSSAGEGRFHGHERPAFGGHLP
jgi:hypothetical protein